MKILLISHIFPPAIDGGSKVIYKLGKYFESQNYQTLYLSSDCSGTDDFIKNKYLKSKVLNTNQIKLPVYHHFYHPLKFLNLFLRQDLLRVFQKGPVFKIIPLIKTIFQILKYKPDLIVAGPLPTTIILYANLLKKITKSKLLINASFHFTDTNFFQKPLINCLKKSDYLWTLTQYETNYFIKNFNINPNKIILVGNGVEESFLINTLASNKTNNILFIGSIASHKKVDLLIKAFSNLKSETTLTIAGQKTLFYPQVEKKIKSLKNNIKSKINFIFDFKQKDLSKLIDSCTVLVLPSIQESFGLVIIEAWARKKPIICTNIPPLKELVQHSNGGLLFQSNNQNDLTKQIQYILDHSKQAEQMGENGFNYVKNNYTWNIVGDKICQKIL